jgi:hypothetical protein
MVRLEQEGDWLRGAVQADGPIDSLEWIVNGKVQLQDVTQQERRPNGSSSIEFGRRVQFESTSWVAVRVWQKSETGRWRFAHTAPIWFDVSGKPLVPSEQERAYLMDRVEGELKRSREVLSADGVMEYEEALEAYRRLVPEK